MASKDQAKKNAAKAKKVGPKEYLKGVKLEMSKVVWPTKKELGTFTGVVIATCAVFALGFWLIDTGVLAALKAVLNITLN
ncbi:MAG: preprotein translocase subunit SecE [Clostridia bacterium]|nr:preprotein translocase subunit SecE [Clostridia bacterium]MDO5302414.1 preprotein translocase subunit SecE [Clostridia bacterium]